MAAVEAAVTCRTIAFGASRYRPTLSAEVESVLPEHDSGHVCQADAISATVLSLPLHPVLVEDEVEQGARAVNQFAEWSVGASGTR